MGLEVSVSNIKMNNIFLVGIDSTCTSNFGILSVLDKPQHYPTNHIDLQKRS